MGDVGLWVPSMNVSSNGNLTSAAMRVSADHPEHFNVLRESSVLSPVCFNRYTKVPLTGTIWVVIRRGCVMATNAVTRRAEIKTRTTDDIKRGATEVFARWGLSLNDAINTFLIKSIEVGGLPFDLRPASPSYDSIAAVAYKPKLNAEGVAVLPADWDVGNGD